MDQRSTDGPYTMDQPGRPRKAILAFTRLERKIFIKLLPAGREERSINAGITQITAWPDLLLAGPVLGAPQAGMVLEIFRRRGISEILSLGWCGSLQPDLSWGDIVLPLNALSEEGTSAHYPLEDGPAEADPVLSGLLVQTLTERGIKYTPGRVWTTDAPFRETRDKVRAYSAAGILAVDMETSAIMTVARFRKISWAGLMVVSDEVWTEKWRPGFDSIELKKGLEKAAEVIISIFPPSYLE